MTGQPQAEALPLWPDEVDVELPEVEVTYAPHEGTPFEGRYPACALDAEGRCHRWNHDHDPAVPAAPPVTTDALVDALAACLSWAEGRSTPNAERVRFWRTLVGRPAIVDQPATPEERRDEGIARASAKWTDEEVALVDQAIATVVERVRDGWSGCDGSRFALEFTTADVWQVLGDRVPVTKGIAGRMLAAKGAGLIENTGTTVIAPRESTGPNHGQRLTVWRAT